MTQPRKPAGSPRSTGGQYDTTGGRNNSLPALDGRVQIEAQDVRGMVDQVDARLLPQCDIEGFEPYTDIIRIGDWGYVTQAAWEEAFKDRPSWAEDAYQLEANLGRFDACDLIAAAYAKGGDQALQDMAEEIDPEVVFWAQADEEGHA